MSAKSRADRLLNECYDSYRIKLFNYCMARLNGSRERADDCVQETFTVFYQKLLSGEEFSDPRAFLYRTADNFVKRQRRIDAVEGQRSVSLDEARDSLFEPEFLNAVESIDYEELAKRLLAELNNEEKELYILRYENKESVERIAELLNLSRPAVSMRLIRMRNKITDMVIKLDLEERRMT